MHLPLPLPPDEQLPEEVAKRLRERPPINIFRLIANAPQCVIPWTDAVQAAYQGRLPARLREVAILRQAARARSEYELHQHRLIALANGLAEEEIKLITSLAPVTSLSEIENLVCAMSDQLETSATLDDATYERARSVFNDQEFVELSLLIGLYCAIARFLNSTRLALEKDNPLAGRASPN